MLTPRIFLHELTFRRQREQMLEHYCSAQQWDFTLYLWEVPFHYLVQNYPEQKALS